MQEIRKILVGVDGSENSLRAAEMAANLANRFSAEVCLMFVIGPSDYSMLEGKEVWSDQATRVGDIELEKAIAIMEKNGIKWTKYIDFGHPVKRLLEQIASYDLVVLGTHGKGAMKGLFMGSVSMRVSQQSPVPVVIVP